MKRYVVTDSKRVDAGLKYSEIFYIGGCSQFRRVNGKQWTQLLKCEASTITAATSPPQLAPYAPRVFGLHPASNGISRGLMEAWRQLHQGAGSLAWEQGVAGRRGIGSSVWGFWHAVNYACIRNVYIWSTKTLWQFSVGSWGGWGSGSDGEGVRLAQLRGEQACNTNQGDSVMDRRLTESPLCLLGDGSSWLSPTMAVLLCCCLHKSKQNKCGC